MRNNTWQILENAVLETLEDRRMMSAGPLGTASLLNGTLTIGANSDEPSKLTVDYTNGPLDPSELQIRAGSLVENFPSNQVTNIVVIGGSGSDFIYIDPRITTPSVIYGGGGNDEIRGGGGNNTIHGGSGNDWIHAEGSSNTIYADSGNDSITGDKAGDTIYAGTGQDSINGGMGWGTIIGANSNDVITNAQHEPQVPANADSTDSGAGINSSGNSAGSGVGPTSGSGSTVSTGGSGQTGSTNPTGGSGSTSGGTGSTGSGDTGTGGQTANPLAPVPVITVLTGTQQVGLGVNVDGLSTQLNSGTPITATYQWDFGDAGSQFNTITGFNASHVYDTPGNYTVTLTVTNQAGYVSQSTTTLKIAASTRNVIYVDSVNGLDTNTGAQNAPLQSVAQAFKDMGNSDNTEILLMAGETFNVTGSLNINGSNVVLGRYGDSSTANPVINRIAGNGLGTFYISDNSNGVTIENLTISTTYGVQANGEAPKLAISGIYVGGENIAIRGCQFDNIDDAINENSCPTGVLIENNSSPDPTGLRGYFVWGQGNQDTIVGNFVANSTREHIVRMVGVNEVVLEDNNFTNLSRQTVDPYDIAKGCIEMHRGSYAYIADNTIADGDIRLGPLGLWGEAPTTSTDWCVIVDNQLTDSFIYIQSGTHDAMIEGNVITNNSTEAIVFSGPDSQGRISSDITLIDNTGIDNGKTGDFVRVYGHVDGIVMDNNLWVAPNIAPGAYSTAGVYDEEDNLSSFTQISGNIWPDATNGYGYANGGINFVANGNDGYLTDAQWDAEPEVQNDVFENVTLGSTYQATVNGQTAGSPLALAA